MAKPPLPNKLNICFVARKFPILGRAQQYGFLWPIARGLAKRGHQVTVIASKSRGRSEVEQDEVRGILIPQDQEDFQHAALHRFASTHKAEPFHVVHGIDDSGYLIGKNKKIFKVAMMYDVQATRMAEVFACFADSQETLPRLVATGARVAYTFLKDFLLHDHALLKTADGMFVTSPAQRVTLERHYLYPEFRTYTVPYGIEIGDLSPRERSEELRKKLKLPINAHTVVTVSDMAEVTEMRNLLRAFLKVAIKKPSARLIILGDGPKKREIEWEMLNLALGSRVFFIGDVFGADLSDYIALADVFVNLSSRTSGFEPSLLEAMAQQKVVVGSEISPIAILIEDGEDGFLLRPADSWALVKLLIKVFSGEVDTAHIGDRARKKVLSFFDLERMLDSTLNAYNQTLINTRLYRKS